jgi:transposase
MRGKSRLSAVEKVTLVRRLDAGERASALAPEAGVLSKSLYQWRAAYLAWGMAGLNRKRGRKPGGRAAAAASSSPDAAAAAARLPDEIAQARIAELERLVGRQQADLDFFREALRSWDEKRRASDAPICSPSSKK